MFRRFEGSTINRIGWAGHSRRWWRKPPPPPGPEEVHLLKGEGTAQIYANFAEPGEYLLRIQVDNWAGPDSAENDQCCWTNVYQRINVVP